MALRRLAERDGAVGVSVAASTTSSWPGSCAAPPRSAPGGLPGLGRPRANGGGEGIGVAVDRGE